jgi:hypothetical protein
MAKKKQHGGKRKGAGRKIANPTEGKVTVIAASVPSGLIDELDGLATERGWNRSQAITEAVRKLLGKT